MEVSCISQWTEIAKMLSDAPVVIIIFCTMKYNKNTVWLCLPPIYYTNYTSTTFINEQPHLSIEIRKKVCNNSTAEQYLNYTQYKSLSVNSEHKYRDDLDFIYIHSNINPLYKHPYWAKWLHFYCTNTFYAPDTHI